MSRSVAERYLAETREILDQLNPGEICAFTDVLLEAWTAGSTIYVCGNGGSASTAQHLAADLFKCTIVDGKRKIYSAKAGSYTPGHSRPQCIGGKLVMLKTLTPRCGPGARARPHDRRSSVRPRRRTALQRPSPGRDLRLLSVGG